jgi:predicted ester cyclase
MSPEILMRTYLEEVVARGRLELIEELSNADMVDEANHAFGGPPGRAGLVAHVKGFRRNIGSLCVSVERIVAGDDSVMAWWSFAGILTGPWLGRPPTGKPIRGSVFSLFDLLDGRIHRYRLFLHAELPESVILDTSRLFGEPLDGQAHRRAL